MRVPSGRGNIAPATSAGPAWPGFDRAFGERLRAPSKLEGTEATLRRVESDLARARGWQCGMGPPVVVDSEHSARLHRFAEAFHRALEGVVRARRTDARVRRTLAMSARLASDVDRDQRASNGRIHLCRLDLIPSGEGGFHVLEANANCPASLVYGGTASRAWRSHLGEQGIAIPPPLAHEDERWAARWYVSAAVSDTGRPPGLVALLREEGGNRTELSELATQFGLDGIRTIEADPRQLTLDRRGVPFLGRTRVHYAYLKLGMREFCRLRPKLGAFVRAVRSGALFVQNGQRGRWLGDNKLCLAVLSDSRFRRLFDRDDWELIRPHVPWSRNATLLTSRQLSRVRARRARYVLKRALDTRGRGVVVGGECPSEGRWIAAVDRAVRESWLVQEFCAPTRIRTGLLGDETAFHDLAVGVVNGRVDGAFIRSSRGLRTNLALSGRMHPVFMGPRSCP